MTDTLPVPRKEEEPEKKSEEKPEGRMTFTEHLAELRGRILWSAGSLIVGFLICYTFSDHIFHFLRRPLSSVRMPQSQKTIPKGDATTLPFKLVSAIEEPIPLAIIESTEGDEKKTYRVGDSISDGAIIEHIGEGVVVLNLGDHFETLGDVDGTKDDESATREIPMTILNPLEPVFVKLKLAGVGAVVLSLPVIIYQICGFVFPGLRPRERNAVKILLFGCTILFVAGFSVAYLAIFPLVLPYLMNWVPEGVEIQLRMNETLSIILRGLLAFAVAFQFPMVVLVLVYMGVLTPKILKDYRKIAIVGLAVMAAFFTPPDPVSMMIMLVPLYLLYEVSIWISYPIIRSRKKAADGTT